MESNSTRFGFVNAVGAKMKKMNDKVNRIIDNFNNEKLYMMDYVHILEQYKELGIGDIDEFCASYAFGMHIGRPYDSPESREAMYLELRDYLNNLKTKGGIK